MTVDTSGSPATISSVMCVIRAIRGTILRPGFANWEPKFPSFGYGLLKPQESDDTGAYPRFVVEVDNIDELLPKIEAYGGKVLKGKYEFDGKFYAVLEDREGNPFYVWQTPEDVTFDEPESQNYYHWDRKPQ